ncbi:farnesol dehydrogenase-like [Macrosteles quadrilineatus]|uniref:farnesol dehydrogenase-like n=1 Tax=Macrosteles quadrilineatus TaxID=74068 RepID=UPI0023E1760B|nr:farnesol dehydrogenase-like [Macrosteles quadrilineatus]
MGPNDYGAGGAGGVCVVVRAATPGRGSGRSPLARPRAGVAARAAPRPVMAGAQKGMERWIGRVALVTGASSGIGAAVARDLVSHGLTVVGLARRKHRVKEIAEELIECRGKLYAVKADISKEEDIVHAFIWVEKTLGGVDILINSASVTASVPIVDGKSDEWKRIFDVNVYGPSICAREAVKSMKGRGVDDGYIININTLPPSPGGARDSILKASKLALTVLTDGLRAEFTEAKSRIKVTCVTPGAMTSGETNKGTPEILRRQTLLEERHVAEMVTFILATPPNIQVSDLTLKPIASKPATFRPRLSK